MQTNELNPKESSSKLDEVTKENWKNILDETGIASSTLTSLENDTFTAEAQNEEGGMMQDTEIGYTEMIDSSHQFADSSMKTLKEWSKEEFETSCRSIINGEMSMETAVDQFGIPEWLLQEKIQELSSKKIQRKKSKVVKPAKKTRRSWTDETMEQAISAVLNDKMSLRASAAKFKIPRSSLYDRIAPRKAREQRTSKNETIASEAVNDIVLSDEKAWVIKSLQDGLLTVEEAALQLGLTNEETKIFSDTLASARFTIEDNGGLKVTIIKDSSKIVEKQDNGQSQVFEINTENDDRLTLDEDRMTLGRDSVKPREFNNEPDHSDPTGTSSPNAVSFNEDPPSDQINGQWANATMLQVCDLRQSTPKSLSVSALPYTMLSGLNSWMNALDSDTLNVSMRTFCSSRSARNWSSEAMEAAIKDVKENGLSIRKSAVAHGIPKSSLADRLSGRTRANQSCLKRGAMKELKRLAKTKEHFQVLRLLKNGQISFRIAAQDLGISYAKMKQFLTRNTEKKAAENETKMKIVVTKDHEYERVSKESMNENNQNTSEKSCDKTINRSKQQKRWKREDMEKALATVKEGKMSMRAAAKFYGIPKSTLGDVVSGKCSVGKNPGPKRLLSDEEENALAGWLITMYKIGRHISVHEVLDTVKAILDKDGQSEPRSKNKLPKTSWWYGFLSRHKEVASLRKEMMMKEEEKETRGKEGNYLVSEENVGMTEEN